MQELILLTGLPASGKSTVSKSYSEKGYKVHSSDTLRIELFEDVSNQENNEKVFSELYKRTRNDLLNGFNVVIDATNLVSKRRIHALNSVLTKEVKQLELHIISELILCPYNECLDRNKARDRKVPIGVIENMYKSWETPVLGEGFDEIRLNYTSDTRFNLDKEIKRLSCIQQHNSFHTLTIGEHCKLVGDKLFNDTKSQILKLAGYLHDISKPYCMQFKNSKGEYTINATYYGHDSTSSYDSLFYLKGLELNIVLSVSILINYHMKIKFVETEKATNKIKNKIGEYLFESLLKLNEYDNNNR